MPLARLAVPFDHRDWVFELKYDGFRALAHIDRGGCRLVSRNGNTKSLRPLCTAIAALIANRAVLDGEIVHLDGAWRPESDSPRSLPQARFMPTTNRSVCSRTAAHCGHAR